MTAVISIRLLEDAAGYSLDCLADVAPDALTRPTPCAGWDLTHLLRHVAESIAALQEALVQGQVAVVPPEFPDSPPQCPGIGLVTAVHAGTLALLDAWRRSADEPPVLIGDLPLDAETVAFIGALEITVHGWDIAEACGTRRPIPAALARQMLRWAPLVADVTTRPTLFAPVVSIPASAGPSDRLVAYLGRHPGASTEFP